MKTVRMLTFAGSVAASCMGQVSGFPADAERKRGERREGIPSLESSPVHPLCCSHADRGRVDDMCLVQQLLRSALKAAIAPTHIYARKLSKGICSIAHSQPCPARSSQYRAV